MGSTMTKKLSVQISLAPDEYSLDQLRKARARLGQSLETGTNGGFNEYRYVEMCAERLDRAIAAREQDGVA